MDGGWEDLLYCGKITVQRGHSSALPDRTDDRLERRTHPRVKTFNRDVFPQAPSPLSRRSAWYKGKCACGPRTGYRAYRRTSFRETVLVPPHSGMLI
jgi:hypothetical protein